MTDFLEKINRKKYYFWLFFEAAGRKE